MKMREDEDDDEGGWRMSTFYSGKGLTHQNSTHDSDTRV